MMKRFVLALISVIGAGICGCNIDLAVDSDAAKCIKVGGIIENGKCKCNPEIAQKENKGCTNELAYVCKNGIYQIAKCGDDSTCDKENENKYGAGLSCKSDCTGGACSEETCKENACSEENSNNIVICINGGKLEKECVNGCENDECKKCEGINYQCINGQRCAADGTWEKCDPNSETEIGKECNDEKPKCSEEEGHKDEWLKCENGWWVSENSCSVNETCRNTNEGIECVPNGNGNANSCGKCDENEKCVDGQCKCDSDKKIRCKNGELQTCNSDGDWEEEGVKTKCLDKTVYHCTDDGNLESAKCADSCNWDGSNSKCSECDPGIHAENCTSGKCNNENVNDWNFGTCIADSGNSETPEKNQCKVGDDNVILENGKTICINNKNGNGIGELHTCNDNGGITLESCKSVSCKCNLRACDGDGDTCGDCKNGDKQCSNYNTSDGNILQICKDGKWQKDDTCNNSCYKDECVDIDNQSCSEEENGNLRCVNVMGSGSIVYVCNNKSWNNPYPCKDGVCNAEYTNCEGSFEVCKDGYKKCVSKNQYIECENGKWNDKKVISLGKNEQCQNGIIVDMKENCEESDGVFSDGQCICVESDRLYTCIDSSCSSLTGNIGNDKACQSMSCNGHKYYCVNNSLYKCNNFEMIKLEQVNMVYSYMWADYNDMGRAQEFNEKVIKGLMELMELNVENNCQYSKYSIYIDKYLNSDCFLEYNKDTGFTCSSSNKCSTNCSDDLQAKIGTITLNNNCLKESRTENLNKCSIKIENCTDIDVSNPDNMIFKVDCSNT